MSDELESLRAKIRLMRELGVTEADGIKLGPEKPAPPKKETAEECKMRVAKAAQRQHDIMFAHSATKPRLQVLR